MEAKDDDASAGYNDFYKGIVETAGGVKGCNKRLSADVPYFTGAEAESTFPVP